jgi:hypothetical protein
VAWQVQLSFRSSPEPQVLLYIAARIALPQDALLLSEDDQLTKAHERTVV